MKLYKCLQCGTDSQFRHSKENKFCSLSCMHQYRYETIKKPQLEEGKLDGQASLPIIIRYVTERDGYKCNTCGIFEWLGERLTLDLDHIDGNKKNNFPSNFRLLCPNCHRQTPTWGNKKRS